MAATYVLLRSVTLYKLEQRFYNCSQDSPFELTNVTMADSQHPKRCDDPIKFVSDRSIEIISGDDCASSEIYLIHKDVAAHGPRRSEYFLMLF